MIRGLGEMNKRGFTIVELLVVVVVIAILASIAIVSYSGITQQARDSKRATEAQALVQALDLYYSDNGIYPAVGSDNTGYSPNLLKSVLVPDYISSIPTPPGQGSSSADYWYVRGTGGSSFGIRVDYEKKPDCHIGRNNAGTVWWGLQAC